MSDYTTTTEEVRDEYSFHCGGWCERCDSSGVDSYLFHEAEFDRWLAEVKADAWEEGMYAGKADDYFGDPDNPYRQEEQQ